MEHIENIYDLLPEEIEKLINKIIEALNIVKDRKNTNSRFVDSEKTLILCPKCNSEHIKIKFKLINAKIVRKNLMLAPIL